ncbi:MAG: YcjX family protein [Azospirillaceae bacterium]|nr:YcjX family protein [Azospirillaceae bacterium]
MSIIPSTDWALQTLEQWGERAGTLFQNRIRLGVTGLRRSGKTVFVTSVIDNLLRAGRLPFLDVIAEGRYQAARLEAHPRHDVPRFAFEQHLSALTGPVPAWPEPTRGLGQIRLLIRFQPHSPLRRRVQRQSTLVLDIVDYPGEWLLDLPLLTRDFATWSAETLALADRPPRAALAAPWRQALAAVSPTGPADETVMRQLADAYTDYLHACRRSEAGLTLLQPGRFIEPGDLAGAPLLVFCPLPPPAGEVLRPSLYATMAERFEAYKDAVVGRFFRDHFAGLDRQIVLVDLLGAMTRGSPAVSDTAVALTTALEAFRHGRGYWLERLIGVSRIDRVLFAATKADHLAVDQHDDLAHLLGGFVADARNAIRFAGASVETMAIAAVKSTVSVQSPHLGRTLSCVRGTPLGRTAPTVLYPGALPARLVPPYIDTGTVRFLDFQPPPGLGDDGRGLSHIRLDRALQFLLGDVLT